MEAFVAERRWFHVEQILKPPCDESCELPEGKHRTNKWNGRYEVKKMFHVERRNGFYTRLP